MMNLEDPQLRKIGPTFLRFQNAIVSIGIQTSLDPFATACHCWHHLQTDPMALLVAMEAKVQTYRGRTTGDAFLLK